MPKRDDKKSDKVRALLMEGTLVAENSQQAQDLYNLSRYGSLNEGRRLQLSLIEGIYLAEKDKLIILDRRNKELSGEALMRKASRLQKDFFVRYNVFRDLRERGYIVKTALKFGADFRVYDRGVKPGEDHAKWVVYPVHESAVMTWYEFAAKNRVAHSTKKRLLLGIADDEGDVSYWECKWVRP